MAKEELSVTISPDLEAQILRYHHVEKWLVGTTPPRWSERPEASKNLWRLTNRPVHYQGGFGVPHRRITNEIGGGTAVQWRRAADDRVSGAGQTCGERMILVSGGE
jgi:hypothetical protein